MDARWKANLNGRKEREREEELRREVEAGREKRLL